MDSNEINDDDKYVPGSESKGLGDTVAKITHALALDKLAEKLAHLAGYEDCGCEDRRKALNQIFPYTKEDEE